MPSLSFIRSFGSTPMVQRTYRLVTQRRVLKQPELAVGDVKPWNVHVPQDKPRYPVYKWGDSPLYKQSNFGLYGGQFIGRGNKVSENGHKTPRKWKVNVVRKHLWSEALQKSIKLKTTGRVLRTLRKEGGLDNYLLKEKSARLKELGPTGYRLKYDVLIQKQNQLIPKKAVHRHPDSKGNLTKVHHIVKLDNTKYKFKVGKKHLLRLLFSNLQKNRIENYTWMEFSVEHQPKSVEELTQLLVENNVNLSHVTI